LENKYFSFLVGHESSDPVIKLVAAIFRIAEIEKRAIEAGFVSLLSPEVRYQSDFKGLSYIIVTIISTLFLVQS
jgi:hypothetical protein